MGFHGERILRFAQDDRDYAQDDKEGVQDDKVEAHDDRESSGSIPHGHVTL